MVAVLGAIGALYGIETGSGWMSATLFALLYGFVGTFIGATLAFAINTTRNWR